MAKTWKVENLRLSVLSVEQGTVIAQWKFNTGSTTDRFSVWWYCWSEENRLWIDMGERTTGVDSGIGGNFQATFSVPNDSNYTKVMCWVKAIPQTNDKGRYKWSSAGIYSTPIVSPRITAEQRASLLPPATPTGSGTMVNGMPVLTITNAAQYATETRVYRIVNGGVVKLAARIAKSATEWTDSSVSDGNVYSYRLKAGLSNNTVSTDYSAIIGPFETKPTAPMNMSATSVTSTSVRLKWTNTGRTGSWYEVQWSDDGEAWENNDQAAIRSSGQMTPMAEVYTVSGLESGKRWYFRVKVGNDSGESWATANGTETMVSVLLGTVPSAPTTFTSAATARVGSSVMLRWSHNSEDESEQSAYEVTVQVVRAGSVVETKTIAGSDSTNIVQLDLSELAQASNGTVVRWSVRTKGVLPDWSPTSASQDVTVWAPPTVGVTLYDADGNELETDDVGYVLEAYPFVVSVDATMASTSAQTVVRRWASITANQSYETIGADGSDVWVYAGQQVWESEDDPATVNASDVLLTEGASYTVSGGCLTSAGITAEAAPVVLTVRTGADELPQPFAEFDFNEQDLSMVIRPWCYDYSDQLSPSDESDGTLTEGVTLSVFRIDSDGLTTTIASGIPNDGLQWVIDPHPRFGTCGYRIMATDSETGVQSATDGFIDTPYDNIVIQWDEDWLTVSDGEVQGEQPVGNRVEIASNISVSEAYRPSVTLKEYDGRRHPVAYFGTQLGQTAKWSGVIVDYYDSDKLDALRRLSAYHGECYVREPSGTGFWATVGNLSIEHESRSAAVGVSLDVTRIEHEGA